MSHGTVYLILISLFAAIQVAYFGSLLVNGYFFTRTVDWITPEDLDRPGSPQPPVLLLYPVLHEAEETMRTTMLSIALAVEAYHPGIARVVAIPNEHDRATIASLRRLKAEFSFLEILEVPPTSDPRWSAVWRDWDANPKAYWWHSGKRRAERVLPAKKTRQLVFTLYAYAAQLDDDGWLLSYLDADSAVPVDYFRIAAAGSARFDVVQLTNVAGNLLDTWASSYHSMDHMAWDGALYPHMTAKGRHPFYVLGKGLFYRVRDLVDFGGFNPWLTIEDPEVGMRLWANGKTLGVSDDPLIEEVPRTFGGGITQRKRWVAGFFQSLHWPLAQMGMTWWQRLKARLNLAPCLSLALNAVGFPLGAWVIVESALGRDPVDVPLTVLCVFNLIGAVTVLVRVYLGAWERTAMVLDNRRDRVRFMARVNPLFLIFGYWVLWLVPLAIGLGMFLRDGGLTWQRTEKVDANHALVRAELATGGTSAVVIDLREREIARHPDVTPVSGGAAPMGSRASPQ